MKIIDLQPADIRVTVEFSLTEVRAIADALERATLNVEGPEDNQNAEQVKHLALMFGEFVDGFDHGTGPNSPRG